MDNLKLFVYPFHFYTTFMEVFFLTLKHMEAKISNDKVLKFIGFVPDAQSFALDPLWGQHCPPMLAPTPLRKFACYLILAFPNIWQFWNFQTWQLFLVSTQLRYPANGIFTSLLLTNIWNTHFGCMFNFVY